MTTSRVVVGYDGSPESLVALEWAAVVAQRRGAPLVVLHAAEQSGPNSDTKQHAAQVIAEEGARRAREFAAVDIEAIGVQQGAAAALEAHSHQASLVVVGHRGRGKLHGALVGSVAFTIATHSACPVSVVRHSLRPLPSQDYPIVAGTDGSQYSEAALKEAARLAVDTGSFLRVVVAWGDIPPRRSSLWQQGQDLNLLNRVAKELALNANKMAENAIKMIKKTHPDLKIEQVVAEGRPEEVIIDAATDASVIVVGARGLGDLASLLLGSVGREIVLRADCAVYIVR